MTRSKFTIPCVRYGQPPDSWSGDNPLLWSEGVHATPFSMAEAEWMRAAIEWVCAQHFDRRVERNCFAVVVTINVFRELDKSLSDGSPFASVSHRQMASALGIDQKTSARALKLLTVDGAPLEVVWKPPRGVESPTKYRFRPPSAIEVFNTRNVPCSTKNVPCSTKNVPCSTKNASGTVGAAARRAAGETSELAVVLKSLQLQKLQS